MSPGRVRPEGHRHRLPSAGRHRRAMSQAGHIYWTNMGSSPTANDGSIERADLDGKNRRSSSRAADTFTPKQIQLDKEGRQALLVRPRRHARDAREPRRLADRDTGRDRPRRRGPARPDQVVRRNHHRPRSLGKSTGRKKARTTPSLGRIFRASIDIPKGESPTNRSDIEVLFDQLAGTHRPRARSDEPRPLLDRPRRSSARQHRQSRVDRQKGRRRRS